MSALLPYALGMRCVLGIDGGGTKTDCVLMDETGAVLARGRAGASNAVNVGVEGSAAVIAAAGLEALRSVGRLSDDVGFILAGISGGGEPKLRSAIQEYLQPTFPKASIVVTSDLVLSLGATGESPSVVVVAGTGSAVLGKSESKFARAGGFGPIIGDPGSANDIGRKTTALCFQRFLNKQKFPLAERSCQAFECKWDEFVDLVREQPTVIFPKIFPIVAKAAEEGDAAALGLLIGAAKDLHEQVREVLHQLQLQNSNFFLAKTGGVFDGSVFFSERFDELVRQTAPKARIGPLPRTAADAAAQMARDALTSPLKIDES
jgi:N-acetylglucosamine kinase-like BadF-type ATPase